MSFPAPGRLAGTVRWAIVPYAPRPPFRLYAGEGHPPVSIPDVATLLASARRGGDAEFSYLVPGKVRPVLILNDPPSEHHQEVTALRLLRLSKLADPARQEEVRRNDDPLLFHLDPARLDLPEENAVIVSALVRVHVDAIDSGSSLGALSPAEMSTLGERIIGFYEFDTRLLVERKIHELASRRRLREEG